MLFTGFSRYLDLLNLIPFSKTQHFWYCTIGITVLWIFTLSSTLFILAMTFDRLFSIVRPYQAVSFNTVKRAKFTIASCITFSILYNIPHLFLSAEKSGHCVPYGNTIKTLIGQIYYWFSFVVNFTLPFSLLLVMNSVIIRAMRRRLRFRAKLIRSQGQGQGQIQRMNSSDKQVFIILLLVTFSFLILTTPAYLWLIYDQFINYESTAKTFADFYFFYSVSQKMLYTNYGINFYLYVLSGTKFREDLRSLFKVKTNKQTECFIPNSSTQFSKKYTENDLEFKV